MKIGTFVMRHLPRKKLQLWEQLKAWVGCNDVPVEISMVRTEFVYGKIWRLLHTRVDWREIWGVKTYIKKYTHSMYYEHEKNYIHLRDGHPPRDRILDYVGTHGFHIASHHRTSTLLIETKGRDGCNKTKTKKAKQKQKQRNRNKLRQRIKRKPGTPGFLFIFLD